MSACRHILLLCTHTEDSLRRFGFALWFSHHIDTNIFTVRKRSCGKVVFSQACVQNSVGGGGGALPWTDRQTSPLGKHPLPAADTPLSAHPHQSRLHPLGRPPFRRPLQRTVCILLECVLVNYVYCGKCHRGSLNVLTCSTIQLANQPTNHIVTIQVYVLRSLTCKFDKKNSPVVG